MNIKRQLIRRFSDLVRVMDSRTLRAYRCPVCRIKQMLINKLTKFSRRVKPYSGLNLQKWHLNNSIQIQFSELDKWPSDRSHSLACPFAVLVRRRIFEAENSFKTNVQLIKKGCRKGPVRKQVQWRAALEIPEPRVFLNWQTDSLNQAP